MRDSNFLKETNARHLWHPVAAPRAMQETPPVIVSAAEGVRITDIDGHTAIDGVGGLWCVNVGYSNDVVKAAIAEQLARMPYYSAFAGTSNEPAIELSWVLADLLKPEGMVRAFFTSGGSDSVETCLRLSRQYHRLRGEGGRTKFLSLKKGYHGTHFGGASVNGNNRFRKAYEPLLAGCFHLPAPYLYRNPFDESDPERLAERIAAIAVDEIEFQGPETIAAFIMEPILGAGGVIVPPASFMRRMREICDRYGILMIADEVITGFGRTGDWTGSRHWGVQPDLMSMAKGITSGYFPFGAAMVSARVAEVFESAEGEEGTIFHGYTYSAHPVGAAAALANIAELKRLDVCANAAARGRELHEGALDLARRHSVIGDVRGGHGLMLGIELVADRDTRAPLPAEAVKRIHRATYEAGAMVRIGGNNILMSPPLTISAEDVAAILAALDKGLAAA